MVKSVPKAMHPKRWTVVTWLAIFLWTASPIFLNLIPSSYWTENSEGQWEETVIADFSEMPFFVGWPFHYVKPAGPFVPAVPAAISYPWLAANMFLIATATAALVYCLQTVMPRFSLRAILLLPLFVALNFGLWPHVAQLIGYDAATHCLNAFYFVPIPSAVALSAVQRFDGNWSAILSKLVSRTCKAVDYENPDDVVALASHLNREGRWEEAILTYRLAAQRWPEQSDYIENCIFEIEEKKCL